MRRSILALFIATIALEPPLLAQSSSSNPAPAVPGGFIGALIMWWICSRRRHQAIGGWLLYFFIQLYISLGVTILLFIAGFENYRPSAWEGSGLYPLFILSTVPGLLLVPVQVTFGTFVLNRRDWKWVQRLKVVLLIDLVFVLIALAIDSYYFSDNVFFDVYSLIWPSIWLPYFTKSKRVQRVFKTKDWFEQAVPVSGTV